jgi:hypothetical protein
MPELGKILRRTGGQRSYAGPNGELLHIAHATKTIYSRPDRLSVSVTGDDGSIKMLYDGKTLAQGGISCSIRTPCVSSVITAIYPP